MPSEDISKVAGTGNGLLAEKGEAEVKRDKVRGRPGKLENLDVRQSRPAGLNDSQQAALVTLRRRVPGADVQFDPITGSANHVMARGRFLTSAHGVRAAANGDSYEPVRQFLNENSSLFGHGAVALKGARVTREDVTAHNGMRTVVWQQEVDAVPVFNTILKANITKDAEIASIGSHFLSEPEAATRMQPVQRALLIARPPVDGGKAISLAAAHLGDHVAPEDARAISAPEGSERRQRFEAPALSDTNAGLTWLPVSADALRLAWDVTLMSLKRSEMFRVVVDATTGEVLVRTSLTADVSDASYRVYANGATLKPYDSPTPFSPGHSTPQSTQPAEVSRNLITLQALDTTASPGGWINDGGTETFGNNVDAHLDLSNTNPSYANGTHASSVTRVFDFPVDLSQAPSNYRDAAITNLFYLCNWYHDKLYALGFTESAGNFQQANFGRGGKGNDAVLADVQDGGTTNNASFSTPADGAPGRMQMYIWTGPAPDRDSAFDAEIVLHEATHGLSNRLVGGGVGISALQAVGMGEGWSDFYSISLLSDQDDDVNGNYARGAYAYYLRVAGFSTNYYFGGRRYPYTTVVAMNPLTLKDIDPTQASPHDGIPLSPRYSSSNENPSEVHEQGQVWCVTLWDARANMVSKHGWAAGNQLMLQLVTDGMKLSPANPTFLQARDAIIQADLIDNGGANWNELWAAFAKRGMGASAAVPVSTTTTGVVEAFDLPDALSVTPPNTTSVTFAGPVAGPFSPAYQIYTLTNTSPLPLAWTASTSQPWMAISSDAGTLAAGGSITVTLAFAAAAESLPVGSYSGSVNFVDTETGRVISRAMDLTVRRTFYVNDSSLVNDIWCTALGDDTNNGMSPDKPKATVQSVLNDHDLEPGDTVRIDTGTYNLTTDITVGSQHSGSAAANVVFEASPYGTIMNRGGGIAWNFVGTASYARLETAQSNRYPAVAQSWLRLSSTSSAVIASTSVNTHDLIFRRIETIAPSTATGITISAAGVILENCLVRGGSTGIAFGTSYSETVRNCTVVGFASRGIDCWNSSGKNLRNNIVVADGSGDHAIYVTTSSTSMVSENNCLVARNGASVGYYNGEDRSTLENWRVATGTDANSLSVEPVFLNETGSNFHLASTSPCRDKGENSSVVQGSLDIDGQARIFGPSVDMGADEFWLDSSIAAWRQQHFTADQLVQPGISGDTADPNHNGIPNLLEYALDGDPRGGSTGELILPQAFRNGATNCLEIAFTRYLDRGDITLTVQASDDLADPWTDLAASVNGAPFNVIAGGASVVEAGTGNARSVTISDLYQMNDPAHPKRFMRLQVTR